jgi:hypothetical protein
MTIARATVKKGDREGRPYKRSRDKYIRRGDLHGRPRFTVAVYA